MDESQLYRIDHYLGKMGLEEILYLRFGNTDAGAGLERNYVECVQITMAEDFGVEDRGHFYDPVGALRDVVVNHLMQVVAAAAMEPPAGGDPKTIKDAMEAVFRAIPQPIPPTTCVASTTATWRIAGVAPDSTTETYAALRLEIDNWRWSGVPFFIRTGKRLPVMQTELRLVFKHPPRLGFAALCAAAGAQPAGGQARSHDRCPDRLGCAPRERAPSGTDPVRRGIRRERRRGRDPVRGPAVGGDLRRERAVHPPG